MNDIYISQCEYSLHNDGSSDRYRIGVGYYFYRRILGEFFVRVELPHIKEIQEYSFPKENILEAMQTYQFIKSSLGGR